MEFIDGTLGVDLKHSKASGDQMIFVAAAWNAASSRSHIDYVEADPTTYYS